MQMPIITCNKETTLAAGKKSKSPYSSLCDCTYIGGFSSQRKSIGGMALSFAGLSSSQIEAGRFPDDYCMMWNSRDSLLLDLFDRSLNLRLCDH